jgi:hypothetical protein
MAKTSFSEVLKIHGDAESDTFSIPRPTPIYGCKAYRPFSEDGTLAERISTWLSQHGFDDWEFSAKASNAFVLHPKDNPEIVLKIHGAYEDKRRIPHLLQPLYVTNVEGVTLEFLPNALRDDPGSAFQKLGSKEGGIHEINDKLKGEIAASGYKYLPESFGLFKFIYEDTKKPRRKKVTAMCYDHDDIDIPNNMGSVSQCTSEYPPLAAQYREQDKIIARDPRLQKLIEEEPQPRYQTTIVKEHGEAILPPIPNPSSSFLNRFLRNDQNTPRRA